MLRRRLVAGEVDSVAAAIGLLMAALAEFWCTACFIFLATGAITAGCHTGDTARFSGSSASLSDATRGTCFMGSTNLLSISIAFGFAIFLMVYAAANLSGAHLNPAVTLAMLVAGRVSLLRALTYILMQITGACLGSVLVKAVDPHGYRAAIGGANRLSDWATVGQAVGAEIILTAILVFVVFAATDTERSVNAAHLPVLAPLAIGIAIFAGNIVAIPIDGASLNPARSFGVAAVARQWTDHWIFWVGPIIGGCVAGLAYELLVVRVSEQRLHAVPGEDKKEDRFVPAGPVGTTDAAAAHAMAPAGTPAGPEVQDA